jgi:peroxiredoxin
VTAGFYISYAALWALVIFQSLVLLGVVRTIYRANTRPVPQTPPSSNGQLIGQPLPKFDALDVFGAPIDDSSLVGRLSALLFVAPDCSTCIASLDEVDALKLKANGSVVVVCRAGQDECRKLSETYGLEVPVIVDEDRRISELFGVQVTPTAVLVGRSGRIQTYGHPMHADEFAELVATGAAQPAFEEAHHHAGTDHGG